MGALFSIDDLNTSIASLTAIDATYVSGTIGLLVSDLIVPVNGPADAEFDNFSVSFVSEPYTIMLFLSGIIGIFSNRHPRYSTYDFLFIRCE